jgi:hypothetical protein
MKTGIIGADDFMLITARALRASKVYPRLLAGKANMVASARYQ